VKMGRKLALYFLCVAAVVAGQTAVVMWQSYDLLYGLGDLSVSRGESSARPSVGQLQQGDDALEEVVRSVHIRIGVIGAASVLAVLGIALVFSVLLTRPIRRLRRTAAGLAEGDLSCRFEYGGKDEFAFIGATFNKIANDLQRGNEALKQANKTMERRIEQRAGDLETAHERLRQTQFELVQSEKMSMLGQLAAGMAHEVNTPTAAILNASVDAAEHLRELLAFMMSEDQLPADTRAWLARMFEGLFAEGETRSEIHVRGERRQLEKRLREAGYANYRRAADIIVACGMTESIEDEDLRRHLSQRAILSMLENALALKVSAEISEASARKVARIVRSLRFYAHEGQGEPCNIEVNESIGNTLVILRNRIKQIAQVRTSLEENLPPVECGADLLQVWTNILINACDAIDESSREGMGLIEITSRHVDGRVLVEISNEGDPIPDDVMQKMFDPFFTTKRVGKGTGLGLSICTGILQRYGGTISARNGDGRVTFEVSLPLETHRQKEKERPEKGSVADVVDSRV